MRRIHINIKINVFVLMMEIVGGLIISSLAVLFNQQRGGSDMVMLTGLQIWYGCVIPSCYLLNSDYIKDTIMEHGWMSALSQIYTKRPVNNNELSAAARNSKNDNGARRNEANSNPSNNGNGRKRSLRPNAKTPRTPRIAWE